MHFFIAYYINYFEEYSVTVCMNGNDRFHVKCLFEGPENNYISLMLFYLLKIYMKE